MKKAFLLAFAMLATLGINAQNLALNKTATASTGDAAAAVDGNADTRWESAQTDNEWWQVDLGEAQEFNTIKILWEGAYTKTFNISVSTDGESFTNILSVTDKTPAFKPTYEAYVLDAAATGRYIKFETIERGTVWGNSFWEFEVYNIDYSSQELTDFTLSAGNLDVRNHKGMGFAKVGEGVQITPKAIDQNGMDYPTDGITYEVITGEGTVTADGVFTATAAGLCEVEATLGTATAIATIYAYAGENLAQGKLCDFSSEASDGFAAAMAFDGNDGTRWGSGVPEGTEDGRTFDAWLTADLGAYYNINLVDVFFEAAAAENYTIQFSEDGETWKKVYYETGVVGLNGNFHNMHYDMAELPASQHVRFVRFYSTKAASQYGVSIFEIKVYGDFVEDIADTEAPTDCAAEVKSTDYTSITFNLTATDNISSAITYMIVYTPQNNPFAATEMVTTTGKSGEATEYTLKDLQPGTAYQFIFSAADAKGNATNFGPVLASTKAIPTPEAAPAPTAEATKVLNIYSDAYAATEYVAAFNNWAGTAKSGEEVELAEGDKAYRIIGLANIYGLEFNTSYDLTDYKTFHVSLWSDIDQTIQVSPIFEGTPNEAPVDVVLTAGQWTNAELSVADMAAAGADITKAYQMELKNGNPASVIYVDNVFVESENEVITAIETVNAAAEANTAIYNLRGQQVNKAQKGIFIQNGKKVVK